MLENLQDTADNSEELSALEEIVFKALVTTPNGHRERTQAINLTDAVMSLADAMREVSAAIRSHTEATERSDAITRKALLVSGRP